MDEFTAPLAEPGPGQTPKPRGPWGPWASIGWTVLGAVVLLGTQVAVLVVFVIALILTNPKANFQGLLVDGRVVAVATLVSAPLIVGLTALLARVRGWRVAAYLALRPAPNGALLAAALGLAVGLLGSDGLTSWLGRPVVDPFMADLLLSAPLWLISLALVVGAPIAEEILFRGFLYRGLAESPRFGPGMAIGITALGWAGMHVQYDLYGVATVYLMGLYLGLIRHWTGSTLATILLHALANAVATAEAVYLVQPG